jgi:hypothetical protein
MPQPPYIPTKRSRRRVCMLVASGMGERGIANALKISRETMRKYYAEELMDGRDTFKAELMDMLDKAARQGNVSAMKHLDCRTSPLEALRRPGLGKKAEQAAAAEIAETQSDWGDDLVPIAGPPQRTN